jgi:hypothetical protein
MGRVVDACGVGVSVGAVGADEGPTVGTTVEFGTGTRLQATHPRTDVAASMIRLSRIRFFKVSSLTYQEPST